MLPIGVLALAVALQQASASQQPTPVPAPEAVAADTGTMRHANGRTPALAFAMRVPTNASRINVDGRLDEQIWARTRVMTNFLQTAPSEGSPATERTEVRILYDDEALYVAARLFDSDVAGIRSQLARRDAPTEADLFEVAFDSYHDHSTSFVFGVNPSGAKTDRLVGNDGLSSDDGWDPVWTVATRIDSVGWTAEFRIPLSQLRYSTARSQVWGVNFFRRIHRKAETTVFAYSSTSDRGYSSFFAHLHGIENLPRSRRLELAPYGVTKQERIDPGAANNPFNDGSRQKWSAGLDAKYGVTSGLTLDATINPDFGQVDADPAFVNLTAFEQFLSERRPFFVEGGDIFNFNTTSQLFYSRRIGRAPQGVADSRGGFVDQPDHAEIAGAGKLSGHVGPWSVGILDATTSAAHAEIDSSGRRFRDEVEPLTNYFVGRVRRDWRGGADQLGFFTTAVNRAIDTPALDFLRTSAYVGGVDFGHRFAGNQYNLTGSFVTSRIAGDTLSIQLAQQASSRYYQRPDAKTNRYRPLATSLDGWSGMVNLGKEAGVYQFGLTGSATSPGFEVNDAGFQTSADDIEFFAFGNRRWTTPGRVFKYAFAGNNVRYARNFDGVRDALQYNVNLSGIFLNNWNADAHFSIAPRVQSPVLTRGGPLAAKPAFWNVSGGAGTDTRRILATYEGAYYSHNEIGGWGAGWFASIDMRPTQAVTVSVQPSYSVSDSKVQYITSEADATATRTFGGRYVFSEVKQNTLDLTTRLNVTFRPDLSLQFYTQPFVATADYHNFKELARAGSLEHIIYGRTGGSTLRCFNASSSEVACSPRTAVASFVGDPDGAGPRPSIQIDNPNFSTRSLSGNAVLRWEYRPGSTLFLVWTTNCSAGGANPLFRAADDVRRLCQGPSNNVFALKANYWMNL